MVRKLKCFDDISVYTVTVVRNIRDIHYVDSYLQSSCYVSIYGVNRTASYVLFHQRIQTAFLIFILIVIEFPMNL